MSRCPATRPDGSQCVRKCHWFGDHQWPPRAALVPPVVDQVDARRLYPFVVRAAANGRCETAWQLRPTDRWICAAGPHDGHIAHALYPADLAAGIYDPDRAIWICHTAADWIAAHPADAHQCGLLNPDSRTTL